MKFSTSFMKTFLILFFHIFCYETLSSQNPLIYIEVPETIELKKSGKLSESNWYQLKSITNKTIQKKLQQLPPVDNKKLSYVIAYTKDGKVLTPDKKMQSASLKSSDHDLHFTFQSTDWPWTEEEKDSLNYYINDLYPVIKDIYGNPFFPDTINIIKDSTLYPASGYYSFYNGQICLGFHPSLTIKQKVRTLIHEIIHAFHNKHSIHFESFEEGMTRATETEVFLQAEGYDDLHLMDHSYYYDVYYDMHNREELLSPRWNLPALTILRYQMAGYAFAKAYYQHPEFFIRFNSEFYETLKTNPDAEGTDSILVNIMRNCWQNNGPVDFETWHSQQHILRISEYLQGDFIYRRITDMKYFNLTSFSRNDNIAEKPHTNKHIAWELYDYKDRLLDFGSEYSDNYGNISIYPDYWNGYRGRVKLLVEKNPDRHLKTSRFYGAVFPQSQYPVFGIVTDQNTGNILLEKLQADKKTYSAEVINGTYAFPDIENERGIYRISYSNQHNQNASKIFIKDSTNYFVSLQTTEPATEKPGFDARMYPNPASENAKIVVELDKEQVLYIDIYNSTGKKIKRVSHHLTPEGLEWFFLDTSKMESGVYFCRIKTGKYQKSIRFSVIH